MIFITIFILFFAMANSSMDVNGMSFFQTELPVAFAFVFTFHDVNVTVLEAVAATTSWSGVESNIILSTILQSIPPSAVEVSLCKKRKSNSDGDCEKNEYSHSQPPFKRKCNCNHHQDNDMERTTVAPQKISNRNMKKNNNNNIRDIDIITKILPDVKPTHRLISESRRQAQQTKREQKINSHRRNIHIIHDTTKPMATNNRYSTTKDKMNNKQHHEVQEASDIVQNYLQIQRVSKREQQVNTHRGICSG